ncbi:UNVERIFIED_CONTAM: hypothetical protein Sradi_5169600 [Sesamum radiatum]|uniref:DUF241 domain protein n=1 Tax=Sesamum radiatum TaxID=300843 RepID=A0AAW2M611_SESRA
MAPKMVTSFRRSLSFPNPPSHTSSKPQKTFHVRSTSLPCRSHPIISQLRDEIAELSSWSTVSESGCRTSAWLCDGLRRLKTVHESLDDLLHLPQTRESLRGGEYSSLIEKLLEDFLRFVDVYGMFQTLVLRLKEEYSAVQIAFRRKAGEKIAVHSKNLNKIAKEIGKLAPNLASIGKLSTAPARAPYDDEAELIDVINDVVKVTVSVSGSLFGGLSNSSAFRKPSCMGLMNFGKKTKNVKVEGAIREFEEIDLEKLRKQAEEEVKMASKKMHETEDCIVEIEGCAERAFRSLINTRVSLLNVLTQ